jgi:hypothetical protein
MPYIFLVAAVTLGRVSFSLEYLPGFSGNIDEIYQYEFLFFYFYKLMGLYIRTLNWKGIDAD